MIDYIDYELGKYYRNQQTADEMQRLGFDDYDEYADYLADLEADAQEAHHEAIRELYGI